MLWIPFLERLKNCHLNQVLADKNVDLPTGVSLSGYSSVRLVVQLADTSHFLFRPLAVQLADTSYFLFRPLAGVQAERPVVLQLFTVKQIVQFHFWFSVVLQLWTV